MINFLGVEFTTKDQPNMFSIVLYTKGCNLKCHGCHNRLLAGWDYQPSNKGSPKFKNINPEKYFKKISLEEIEIAIKNDFLQMIILCGGEFLIYPLKEIEKNIIYFKKLNPKLLIRIDTNGTFPEKVQYLKDKKLVDGFAIDIKGPYWDESFYPLLSKVIGIEPAQIPDIAKKIMKSISIADNMTYSLFRTVLYPIIKENNYFEEIKKFTKTLKSPHYFNTFQSI